MAVQVYYSVQGTGEEILYGYLYEYYDVVDCFGVVVRLTVLDCFVVDV